MGSKCEEIEPKYLAKDSLKSWDETIEKAGWLLQKWIDKMPSAGKDTR